MHQPTTAETTVETDHSRDHMRSPSHQRTPRWHSLCLRLLAASTSVLLTALVCVAPAFAQVGAGPALPHLAQASEGVDSLQLWHAVARAAIVRQRPNQQAALRMLALLSTAQHRAADAFAQGGPASEDAWRVLFDTVSSRTLAGLIPAERESIVRLAEALVGASHSGGPVEEARRAEEAARTAADDTLRRAAVDRFNAAAEVTRPDDTAAWRSLLQPARPPHLPLLGTATPIFLSSGAALRPPAPPALGSPAFDEALVEVKDRLGRVGTAGLERAKRWEMVTGSLVAGFWDETAVRLAARHGLPGRQASLMLAASLGATWDANIACHDAKYTYWTPRPPQVDPAIQPLVGLPNHPSYPSNHACDSSAAAEALAAFFPTRAAELRSMAREAGESRIDGGIHYRFDVEAGLAIGRGAALAALAALGPTPSLIGATK